MGQAAKALVLEKHDQQKTNKLKCAAYVDMLRDWKAA